jgi:LysW-gamma-L-alpha-aminoadipyl-6-phosphate/LysW-L-glutamyl-5-phosphate reductase
MRASIIGGSGYIGGELLRLLLQHPKVEVAQVTSNRFAGRPLHFVHPNLRGQTGLHFVPDKEVTECDVVFLALPHGVGMKSIERWAGLAPRLIDLSADFRLRNPADYDTYYDESHSSPEWLERFVYGAPEVHRERLREARYIAVPGCIANTSLLGLYPLAKAGLLTGDVFVDGRVGSSAAGNEPSLSTHHPERSGAVRIFKATDHRHTAEIRQVCQASVHMTATAIEAVRGVQAVSQVMLPRPMAEKEVWAVFRGAYGEEPFIRLVKQRAGVYRLPEPAQDPERHELLRHRLRARRGRPPPGGDLGARQPRQGRLRQCRPVPEHRGRLGRARRPAVPRPPPDLKEMSRCTSSR